MRLTKDNLINRINTPLSKPDQNIFDLPERILQFGTGVLLRALPDYFVDKANKQGIFNGRIVVVKSTAAGDINDFSEQDCLYTLCVRGISEGKKIEEDIICSPISRVIDATKEWNEVLACAHNPDMNIVISNTTEKGIELKEEDVFAGIPTSFPGKLLAFLHERYLSFDGNPSSGLTVVPTELIDDNGQILRQFVVQLANYNRLDDNFLEWLQHHNHFCNSLVDCIVPGRPAAQQQSELELSFGYQDKLMVISEPFRLWAIEAPEHLHQTLSFSEADQRMVLTTDIKKYKELKLRLLNATHSLCCGLAHLSGFETVRSSMENETFSEFVTRLMLDEIAFAIPYDIDIKEASGYALEVLQRFRNPYIEHKWLSIATNYTSKLKVRSVPVLKRHYELFEVVPEYHALCFAAYILFMRPSGNQLSEPWLKHSVKDLVRVVLQNKNMWGHDLTELNGFEDSVTQKLESLMENGALSTIEKTFYKKPK